MGPQLTAFPMGAKSPRMQRAGASAGTFVGLREGESPIPEQDAVPGGVSRRHRREHWVRLNSANSPVTNRSVGLARGPRYNADRTHQS
jgi:hypothetical protein